MSELYIETGKKTLIVTEDDLLILKDFDFSFDWLQEFNAQMQAHKEQGVPMIMCISTKGGGEVIFLKNYVKTLNMEYPRGNGKSMMSTEEAIKRWEKYFGESEAKDGKELD